MIALNSDRPIKNADILSNFPFTNIRDKQAYVLNELRAAYNSGYKFIILEAPNGFGKSPVAVAIARTLGSSYLCTATKELQTQYSKDFPYFRVAKGKKNFPCLVKEDLIRNDTYRCRTCASDNAIECSHTTVEDGPCKTDESFKNRGCKYRTFLRDYRLNNNPGTGNENVSIDPGAQISYQKAFSEWSHFNNLKEKRREWEPCGYYDQLNAALTSIHSIFNYPIFFGLLHILPSRELLVLDEGHLLETEIVKDMGLSISKRGWKRYIPNLDIVDYGYDDIENWTDFLEEINENISSRSNVGDDDELPVEAMRDIEKLTRGINNILSNPKKWIVSEIRKKDNDVFEVEFKPIDISPYCNDVFQKCRKTLIMSATILNKQAFCRSVGLTQDEVKFIQVDSDFPPENRPIYPMNIAYLDHNILKLQEVKVKIAVAIDNLMTLHKNQKGIIHTTSYEQVNFIVENISDTNADRLLVTDPAKQRDEVIAEHSNSP